MTTQFDFTRVYDVIMRNSVFQLGFLTREFQIPKCSESLSNKYNGINSFATFNDGFNLKIKRDSFNERW